MNINDQVTAAVNALYNQEGAAYTSGYLTSCLIDAIGQLPKTKQKAFLESLKSRVGQKVKVKVINCISGQEVEIPWDQRGSVCDPSTERFHCM